MNKKVLGSLRMKLVSVDLKGNRKLIGYGEFEDKITF